MIDTIKLILDKSMFWITNEALFEKGITNAGRGYAILVQNPTQSELKAGIYKPRLTLTNRFNASGRSEKTLSVELSLPKLLYGNNFDELITNDFNAVLIKLRAVLKDMGVRVFTDVLAKAPVSAIHYSKNIPLVDGSTPHYIINKIKESNVTLALDVNQTDYRNGYSFKWHCNSYEVTFYDKIKDLEDYKKKGNRRAIENDNELQLGLFDSLYKRQKFEVLRMEVRLNTRTKIKQLLQSLHINKEPIFRDLFNFDISQKVLLNYLDIIESNRLGIFDVNQKEPQSFLAELAINNPKLGTLKTLQVFGLKQALQYMDIRQLRAMLGKYSNRSWYRLISEARKVKLPAITSPFKVIRDCLVSFKSLKLVDFQGVLLNNDKYER
ncbi:MAG: hypothetical protein ACD_57C00224G0001 [uncultured bacterium]|nr:MAG: hypothetical protein ACD_57C00224G0001 [uncultured bacterium]